MKFAVVQNLSPSSTGTQDFTDSTIASDWQGGLIFAAPSTANTTTQGTAGFVHGMLNATVNRTNGIAAADAAATSQTSGSQSGTFAYRVVLPNGSSENAAAYSSTLSNGVRINHSTATTQRLVQMILAAGSDVAVGVTGGSLTNGTPGVKTYTHGLSANPDVIIASAYHGTSRISHGFYDRVNNSYACVGYANTTGQVANTALGARVSDERILNEVSSSASVYGVTLGNFATTTFDATATSTTDTCDFTSIKITAGAYKVGILSTPTSTGAFSITCTGILPKLVIFLPTRVGTLNSTAIDDSAGHFGQGAAANAGGTIQQMCAVMSSDDGALVSVEKSYTDNAKALVILDVTGAPDFEAVATGMTYGTLAMNASNVAASAYLVPYLILGDSADVPTFTVSPTITSRTSTTMVAGYTPSAAGTFYMVAVAPGASDPTAAQIIAGSGGGILFASSEAVTGADSTTLTFSGTTFPKYKICCVFSNVVGTTSVVSLDNEFLSAPTGKQFQVLTTPIASTSPLVNASPAPATNDVWVLDLVTTPNSFVITPTADGDFTIANGSDESPQTIAHDLYDNSLVAYYGAGTIYVNYFGPGFSGSDVLAYPLNVAITNLDLTTLFVDPQGNALTVTAIDTPPSGLSVVASSLTGTPDTKAITIWTIRATGISGDYTEGEITTITGTITVPNVVGLTATDASAALNAVYLNAIGNLSGDTVISQTPIATSEVNPFSDVLLAFANGFGQLFGHGFAFRFRIGF